MKILHLDEQKGWRGGEQQASWLVRGLGARGHEVWVAGRPDGEFVNSPAHGDVAGRLPLPLRGEWDLPSARRIARFVRDHGIDLIHAHTSHAHGIAALARGVFKAPARLVVSRRVSFPPAGHFLNRWKYAQPDRFLCVSRCVARVLRDWGAPPRQIEVVHSAVDAARVAVEPLPRGEMGVPDGVPLLVSAGALVDHKDHASLLRAFARVSGEFPGAWLVIAGGGKLRADLERLAAELGLADRVRFLGHRPDAPRIIRAGDVYVSSSTSEGLGTSILEALASGTPVVATRAGGADEMVIPHRTGWLVPVGDPEALANAVAECLRRPEDAGIMAKMGRELAETAFSAEKMIEGTLAVYTRLLDGAGPEEGDLPWAT
ncbi:MAG: glycosyltransferase [Candidatus Hydrogenedentes bacterium]|nr:glycosyltransferase [Candidatus Hydrogenedentota bacterium]